jgi:hypothetical protein
MMNCRIVRSDFAILVYPVITMSTTIAHKGSQFNLLGKRPRIVKVLVRSSEEQVTVDTLPTSNPDRQRRHCRCSKQHRHLAVRVNTWS